MQLRRFFLRSFDRYAGAFFALLLAIPALLPLLTPGMFDSHDGILHLYRLRALDDAIRSGILYPRVFPDLAYGYGFPILNYYSPLSYYVAEGFRLLGFGYIDATKLVYATGFLLSSLFMYIFAREHFPKAPSVLAAVVYVYAPYHLADAYLRGAIAEFFAFVFMPAALWSISRTFATRNLLYGLFTSLALAGLVLTHNLTVILFGPVFLAYIGYHFVKDRDSRPLLMIGFSIVLAVMISAFYWLPAVGEMPNVLLGTGSENLGYSDHLAQPLDLISPSLLYRYFPNQGGSHEHPLGLVYMVIIVLGIVGAAAVTKRNNRSLLVLCLFFGIIFAAAAFLTLTPSNPVWEVIRPLRYLQYPWRFQTVTVLAGALLAGFTTLGFQSLFKGFGSGRLLPSLFVLVITTSLAYTSLAKLPVNPLPLSENDITAAATMQFDFSVRQIGTTWSAEYLPLTVKEDRSVVGLPAKNEQVSPSAQLNLSHFKLREVTPLSVSLSAEAGDNTRMSLHAFDFPGWKGYVDGREVEIFPTSLLGLVTLQVPAGQHEVTIRFEDTPLRTVGTLASIIGLILLAGIFVRKRQWRILVPTVLLIFVVLALGYWHIHSSNENSGINQLGYSLDDVALVGYSVDKNTASAGDHFAVTLYWLSLKQTDQNYSVYVHLIDKTTRTIWSQNDNQPGDNFSPTSRWEPGEIVPDRHEIAIPSGTQAGDYELRVGMYDQSTMKNLPVVEADTGSSVEAIYLGSLQVTK